MDVKTKIENKEYDVTDEKLLTTAFSFDYTKEERREARMEYDNLMYEARLQFKADLEEEFEIVGHPKADRLFEMAWDKGHSSGYLEVYYEYDQLVELLT